MPASVTIEGIRKVYGATIAVDDVSFAIEAGSVHALLGENGAGKSTFVKLLSGLTSPDAGGFRLFGTPVRLSSPHAAHAHGVQTAFHEMTLVRDLTVLDNMLLPYGPVGAAGTIRRRLAREAATAHLAKFGLRDIDLDDDIAELNRRISRRRRIDTLSAGIGPPLALTRKEIAHLPSGRATPPPQGVAGIRSEWPTSNRISGRHELGMPGRLAPEYADSGTNSVTKIAQQVPAVGDLNSLWRTMVHSIRGGAGAVTRDDRDTGVLAKPTCQRFRLSVRQKVHNLIALPSRPDWCRSDRRHARPEDSKAEDKRRAPWM